MEYVVVIALLVLSALFSGLTLGLMGLDVQTLKRKARLGDLRAARIYPIRKRGNQLLTTLLLGNVAVNAILAVFLGSLVDGVTASLAATALIFIFGEILPQAAISRYAMAVGAHTAPAVSLLMQASTPVTYPIAWTLNKLLGEELPEIYSKREIMEIISEHEDSADSPIDEDEERIIHGALQFSHRRARTVMTPREQVVWFDADQALDENLRTTIAHEAFSRYPVLSEHGHAVFGVLFVKDIITASLSATVGGVCERSYLRAYHTETLDTVLTHMLETRQHMAIVSDETSPFVGVITLEDILEEVLQQEIFDEGDKEECVRTMTR